MTISTIDESQRKAAKVAGSAYLFTFATVVYVNFGIHDRLIVENNAETARNILAHERLFRIGIAGDLIYCAGVVVLLTALYVILKPVNRGLALLAAFWRLVWVLMWLAGWAQHPWPIIGIGKRHRPNPSEVEKANATAVQQWRSWLRGADLNRRPLGYAI
jgi:hypothetical protein